MEIDLMILLIETLADGMQEIKDVFHSVNGPSNDDLEKIIQEFSQENNELALQLPAFQTYAKATTYPEIFYKDVINFEIVSEK
jgi:hypothetical protein